MPALPSADLNVILQTMNTERRVYLTPLEDKHISRYLRLSDDPELVATEGWKPFGTDEKERFLQTLQVLTLPYCDSSETIIFSIISAADNKAIGYVSIKGINEAKASAELGIGIMEKEYRSQGYGTEALELVVNYAFNNLGLALLGLTVFPTNQRAIRAYEKVGFRKRKFLKRSWLMPSSEYVDMWLMELRRDQWALQ